MIWKLLPLVLLTFLPLNAVAEDASTTSQPAVTNSANYQSGGTGVNGSPDGPGGSGGSSADGSALQPTAGSGLGSSTQASTGLTPSAATILQAPSDNSQKLQVLLGSDAAGPRHDISTSDSSPSPFLEGGLLVMLLLLGVAGFILHRNQKTKIHESYARKHL